MDVQFWEEMISICDKHIDELQNLDIEPKLPKDYRLTNLWIWIIKKIEYCFLLLNTLFEDLVIEGY